MNSSRMLSSIFGGEEKVIIRCGDKTYNRFELKSVVEDQILKWKEFGVVKGSVVALDLGERKDFFIKILSAIEHEISIVPFHLGESRENIEYKLSLGGVTFCEKTEIEWTSNPIGQGLTEVKAPGLAAFTSGTTASPKLVFHSWKTLIENAKEFNSTAGISAEVNMYHIMPGYYMAGILNTLISPLFAGGTVTVGPAFSPASALQFWSEINKNSVNTVWCSPTMLAVLSNIGKRESSVDVLDSSLKNLFVGTGPLLDSIKEQFEATFGITCRQSYGMTEVLLVSVQHSNLSSNENDVGVPLQSITLKINEESGELLIKSPFTTTKIISLDECSNSISWDKYFSTGDVAKIGETLEITGRLKDLIIKGGENISPNQIENAIMKHPGVIMAAVLGKPDPVWGEIIIAYVTLDRNKCESISNLKRYLTSKLPKSWIPNELYELEKMPQGPTGKVMKHLIGKVL